VRNRSQAEEKGIMKRFHVHVAVENLAESIRFYATLFGAEPTVRKADYAKWMVDDPRINFAISSRGSAHGVNHLGFQVDSDDELRAMRERLTAADAGLTEEPDRHCCYAVSDKYWVTDPQGIAWETYHSLTSIPVFGEEADAGAERVPACCTPASAPVDASIPVKARAGCCS
jgi:catechol 2,3-dioxygenase-like lactoylglutathione lyase family enzyme